MKANLLRGLMLGCAIAVLSVGTPAQAATIWTDWTTLTFGDPPTSGATGVVGGIGVTYDGQVIGGVINGSSAVWAPGTTYVGGTVTTSPASVGDEIQINGGISGGTITFAVPVTNPVFAIWSLGQVGGAGPASFTFDATPTFEVGGPNSQYGGSTITVLGNVVSGAEGNGVVQFDGTFSSISWTNTAENFYSFTVGLNGESAAVPEPASVTLVGFGLLGLVTFLKKKRR